MKEIKRKLLKFTRLELLDTLDKYWTEWVSGMDLESLVEGYTLMLIHGSIGYNKLTKSELVNYIIRNLDDDDIEEYFISDVSLKVSDLK